MVSSSTRTERPLRSPLLASLLVNRQTYTDILQFKLFQTDLDQFGYIWYQPKPQIHWGPGVNNLHLNSKIYGIRFAFGNTVFEALPRTSCNSTFLQTTPFISKYFKTIFIYRINISEFRGQLASRSVRSFGNAVFVQAKSGPIYFLSETDHVRWSFSQVLSWQWCWWHRYVGDLKLVTIWGCWWLNFDVGDIFWMLVPDINVKR